MARGTDFVLWSQDRDIITRAVWPGRVRRTTGLMLVVHGFGNSRFQYAEMMDDFAERMDVVCVSPEYRDSGRDSGMGERGARRPYDSSHKQVIDSLNSFRRGALEFPQIDHSRRFVWGGSQGGHIALLATVFAPNTFVLTMDLCGKVHPFKEKDTGASLAEPGKLIRSADVFASRIRNKVFICHGTADDVVPVEESRRMEEALREARVEHHAVYVDGGDHFLRPVTTRAEQTVLHCYGDITALRADGPTDFEMETVQVFPCAGTDYEVSFAGGWARIGRRE